MLFWILTIALTLSVGIILAITLFRGSIGDDAPAAYDLQVYRDQLKEIDRDLARGVIGAEDAERTRSEISRRIIAADAQVKNAEGAAEQPQGVTGQIVAVVATAVLLAGAFGLYQKMGAPGFRDQGLKVRIAEAEEVRRTRPNQAAAEADMPERAPVEPSAEYAALMQRLRETVAKRPEDIQGQRLLARNEAILGNFQLAYSAQAKVVAALGDAATPADLTDQADMMILAAGGYVSPEAESLLLQTLQKDPQDGVARYYLGLMFAQVGRPDATFKAWSQLEQESRPEAPWMAPIRSQIEEIAQLAGVNYTPPTETAEATVGPDADDIAAASALDDAERKQMIQGMVERLADRLATEGGSPQEWGRLLNALGVLGDRERAAAIWSEAQQIFATAPEALAIVRAGAVAAKVAE